MIFLDGLHTYEQTLRDLLNALPLLKPRGAIVLDDVLPNSELAALPERQEAEARQAAGEAWDGSWMGDVYRLVFFIESFLPGWSYRTTADNLGQLVMWRSRRGSVPERRMEEIARLPYAALEGEMAAFRRTPFAEIRTELVTDLRIRAPAPWTAGRVLRGVRRRLPGASAV